MRLTLYACAFSSSNSNSVMRKNIKYRMGAFYKMPDQYSWNCHGHSIEQSSRNCHRPEGTERRDDKIQCGILQLKMDMTGNMETSEQSSGLVNSDVPKSVSYLWQWYNSNVNKWETWSRDIHKFFLLFFQCFCWSKIILKWKGYFLKRKETPIYRVQTIYE